MTITKGLLSGVRILDLTQALAGPFGTMLLGDLGAEIIKIEPPSGDLLRMGEAKISPSSYYFTSVSRNKKSVILDIQSESGLEAFYDLAKISDVVVSNYRAGVVQRQKTDFETLKKINPGIIRCNLSGYGESGPCSGYPSYDIIACGESGILSLSGEPGQTPIIPGGIPMADISGGILSAFMILAALFRRDKTGRGIKLEPNLLDSLLLYQQLFIQTYLMTGEEPGLQGKRHRLVFPYGIYTTKGGFMTIGPADTDLIIKLVGLEWMFEDSKFKTHEARKTNRQEFETYFEKALLAKTTDQWIELLRDNNDIACGHVKSYEQLSKDPQIIHNNMICEMEINGEKYRTLKSIFRIPDEFEGTPDQPPDLGENTMEILKDHLQYSDDKIDKILADNKEAMSKGKLRIENMY